MDIDIFHDNDQALVRAALADAVLLEGAGYEVRWVRRDPGIWTAIVRDDANETSSNGSMTAISVSFP
ncbi:MAG: hypothetical protein WDN01_18085 [Rhizomicrobium sp.]